MTKQDALAGNYSFFTHADEALKNYHEYGFHLEKNIFDSQYCDELIKQSYTLSGALKNDFKPFMMPHRENPIFFDTLKQQKLLDIIRLLVGGNPVALQTKFFYSKPGTQGFSLHQDNFFVRAPFGKFASAWIALVDTYPNNGGLTVFPSSHKEGLLPVRDLNIPASAGQDPNAGTIEAVVPERYTIEHLCIPKGSALFLDANVVHGSNLNQSNENRYVLLNTYLKEGETFRKGNYAQREAIILA